MLNLSFLKKFGNIVKLEQKNLLNHLIKYFIRWFCSTNAKDIGILYIIFGFFSAILGTSFSLIIRMELASIGNQFIFSEKYNQIYNVLITAHAIIMIFFFVMPILIGGFGNFLIPILIGAMDTAYPRINNFAFWLLPPIFRMMRFELI